MIILIFNIETLTLPLVSYQNMSCILNSETRKSVRRPVIVLIYSLCIRYGELKIKVKNKTFMSLCLFVISLYSGVNQSFQLAPSPYSYSHFHLSLVLL